ncbi:MAG TPA: hypothetical protein VKK06_20925, partial [Terriglobia bacterium]|nr:hypothetical protein [Terriglobia bacterium]
WFIELLKDQHSDFDDPYYILDRRRSGAPGPGRWLPMKLEISSALAAPRRPPLGRLNTRPRWTHGRCADSEQRGSPRTTRPVRVQK